MIDFVVILIELVVKLFVVLHLLQFFIINFVFVMVLLNYLLMEKVLMK